MHMFGSEMFCSKFEAKAWLTLMESLFSPLFLSVHIKLNFLIFSIKYIGVFLSSCIFLRKNHIFPIELCKYVPNWLVLLCQ